MAGILQNKSESGEHKQFTRDQVLENTKLNSQLGQQGEELRRKIAAQSKSSGDSKPKYPKTKAPAALQFNEEEIEEYDKTRGQHEIISEPKTPFTGTAETTDYYDNEEIPEPDEFDLGEVENDRDVV